MVTDVDVSDMIEITGASEPIMIALKLNAQLYNMHHAGGRRKILVYRLEFWLKTASLYPPQPPRKIIYCDQPLTVKFTGPTTSLG